MKPTENNYQLLERFTKRSIQLSEKLDELRPAYEEYIKTQNDLMRLVGSLDVMNYIMYGTLPKDGNHDGMKDHNPDK